MLSIVILLAASIVALSMIDTDNSQKVLNEYCSVECKQNIKNKYKFCC